MNFPQVMIEALRCLAANRLRTALTMLGIVIGIASVVLMLSVGDAVTRFIERELSVLGSNQLIIQRGTPTGSQGPPRRVSTDAAWLTLDDALAIDTLPSVKAASAALQGSFTVHYGDDSAPANVLGVMPQMFKVRNWPVDVGVAFTDDDMRAANRVIVIGSRVAQAHFLRRDPLGQVVRVAGRPFTVIGVLAGSGRTLDGTDLGELMVVPITALPLTVPLPRAVHYINVQAASEIRLQEAEREVTELMRERRRITGDAQDDFNVTNLASIAQSGADIAAALALGLGTIGAISLLVGGIGIMNIMLVSVSERVREIGIRMAIGAQPRHVLMQFLAEAVVMCIIGGLLGVGLAAAVVWSVNRLDQITMALTAIHVAIAVFFATAVGLFFGWYPARRASKLLPMECLRQE